MVFWNRSSIPEYNHVQRLPRACHIRSTERDHNRDGRIDELDMIISIPLTTDEQIQVWNNDPIFLLDYVIFLLSFDVM